MCVYVYVDTNIDSLYIWRSDCLPFVVSGGGENIEVFFAGKNSKKKDRANLKP